MKDKLDTLLHIGVMNYTILRVLRLCLWIKQSCNVRSWIKQIMIHVSTLVWVKARGTCGVIFDVQI